MATRSYITVIGNLTGDPKFEATRAGNGYRMLLSIADNWKDYRGTEHTAFYNASCFIRKESYDWMAPYYQNAKGKLVIVRGELKPIPSRQGSNQPMFLAIDNASVVGTWKSDQPRQQMQPMQQQAPQQSWQPPASPPPLPQAPAQPQQRPMPPAMPNLPPPPEMGMGDMDDNPFSQQY